MSVENETLVRGFFAALDAGELDRAYAMCTPDFSYNPPGGIERDIAQHRRSMHDLHAAFGDSRHEVIEQFSTGDRVATRFVFSGVLKGPYKGMQPNGKRMTCGGIALDKVVGGKLAERWVEVDFLGLVTRGGAKVAAA
jgi:predicted ester cyclase